MLKAIRKKINEKRKLKEVRERRLEKYWDVYAAEERYRLMVYIFYKGKLVYSYPHVDGEDKEWAKKTAKHYGLTITDPIEEEY